MAEEDPRTLAEYASLLLKWNAHLGLVGTNSAAELWASHIAPCAALTAFIPQNAKLGLDIGSGGGLPGLVLAIHSQIPFHLVESDRRKAAFLREAARVTGAPVTVHAARIESLALPRADLVTARALASLPDLLALALPHLTPGGLCLFPKGQNWDPELRAAEAEFRFSATVHNHPVAGIVVEIRDLRR